MSSQKYYPSSSSSASAASSSVVNTPATSNESLRSDYFNQSHAIHAPMKEAEESEEDQRQKMAAMEEHGKRFAAARDGYVFD